MTFSKSTKENFSNKLNGRIQSSVNAARADMTISATITTLENVDIGQYRAEYEENQLVVFSQDPLVTYKKGERVYVLVPQGDFSSKKIIIGRSSYSDNMTNDQLQKIRNFYEEVGPKWQDLFKDDFATEDIGICACPESEKSRLEEPANYEKYVYINVEEKENPYITQWAGSGLYLKIQGDFSAIFQGSHSKGKYFLRVICLQKNPNYVADPKAYGYDPEQKPFTLVSFDLGFDSFEGGDFYGFGAPTTQKAYFKIPEGGIVGLKSVALMQNGEFEFDTDQTYEYKGKPLLLPHPVNVTNRNNIFVENISVGFARAVNLGDSIYYPQIEMPYGYYLGSDDAEQSGRSSVTLIAHLHYGDTDITEDPKCEVHWFRQRADIAEGADAGEEVDKHGKTYFFYGGPGWYPIEKFGDGSGYSIGGTNGNQLTIAKEAILWRWKYKAVIVYVTTEQENGKEYYKELNRSEVEQEVINRSSKYDLEIVPVEGDNTPGRYQVVDHKSEESKILGTWYDKTNGANYKQISGTAVEGPVNILDNPAVTFRDIYIQCFDAEKYKKGYLDGEIGTLYLRVGTETADKDGRKFIVNWVGTTYFSYDADGQWKGEKDGKEYVLTPVIRFAEDYGTAYAIKIFAPDGAELGDQKFYDALNVKSNDRNAWSNKEYMIKNAYIDSTSKIHFTVDDKYDAERAMGNVFKLEITTANQEKYAFEQAITFVKDGDLGTNGTEWDVRVLPCNWQAGSDGELYSKQISAERIVPLVLIPKANSEGNVQYKQDDIHRLFLRPFVSRNGVLVEDWGKEAGYWYKCDWDVRTPGSDEKKYGENTTKNSSFLRLYHTANDWRKNSQNLTIEKTPFDLINGGKTETGENGYKAGDKPDQIKVYTPAPDSRKPEAINGLTGYTQYPMQTTGTIENYGAVEVRYFNDSDKNNGGSGATLDNAGYRFIVKCTVTVMQGEYAKNKDGVSEIDTSNSRPITTLVSYYPVDVIICKTTDKKGDLPREYLGIEDLIETNWPIAVQYDAVGYTPKVSSTEDLYFKCDGKEFTGINAIGGTCELIPGKEENRVKYKPIGHLSKDDGYHSALKIEFGKGDSSDDLIFIRNQIMYYNRFGNTDINGWDGEGLDTNEENGTIFGATFGAGFKVHNGDNCFTGILMGVDKNMKREDYDKDSVYTSASKEEIRKSHPYLTGLFGYQEGIQSFGLMENGTAYFGRADRGGRIIIDGSNATLYGGANGLFTSPSINDPMWNTARISLVDLNHANNGDLWELQVDIAKKEDDETGEEETKQTPVGSSIRGVNGSTLKLNFDAKYFGYSKDQEAGIKIPEWYQKIWRNAYLVKDGEKPYWMLSKPVKINSEGEEVDIGIKEPLEINDLKGWNGKEIPVFKEDDSYSNRKINYYDNFWTRLFSEEYEIEDQYYPFYQEDSDLPYIHDNTTCPRLEKVYNDLRAQGETLSISSFGPSRASTTPAIEIGQHIHGLRPGLIDWGDYEAVYKNQEIPGDRNFMVTYDGTMWAMNGVFMGNVIGANVLGGRIQGSQIGIGQLAETIYENKSIKTMYAPGANIFCAWKSLSAPNSGEIAIENFPFYKAKSKFYADENGVNGLMEITGGSLDVGGFHIFGWPSVEKLMDRNKKEQKDYAGEIGHLVQEGKSDFIGETHFYGNVGIAPNLNEIEKGSEITVYNSGNFTQTNGFVALGISLMKGTEGIFNSHSFIQEYILNRKFNSDSDSADSETPISYPFFAAKSPHDYEKLAPYVGEGTSVEHSAVFCIDMMGEDGYSSYAPGQGGINGHLWPLHFHIEATSDAEDILSLVTVMDQFRRKTVLDSVTGVETTNYFRIASRGPECQTLFIRNDFQAEQTTEFPAYGRSYRGYFGIVPRKGSKIGGIGISSWNDIPLILKSDDAMALRTKGWFMLGGNVHKPESADNDWWIHGDKDEEQENVVFEIRPFDKGNKFARTELKSVISPISIGVFQGVEEGGEFDPALGEYRNTSLHTRGNSGSGLSGALIINPRYNAIDGGRSGEVILACESNPPSGGSIDNSGVHIYCTPSGKSVSADCFSEDNKFAELFINAKGTYLGIGPHSSTFAGIAVKSVTIDNEIHKKLIVSNISPDDQEGIYARFA